MKRFDNKHRDEGKKRPNFGGRDRNFGDRREGGFEGRPAQGARHGYEARGGQEGRSGGYESRGRTDRSDERGGYAGRDRSFGDRRFGDRPRPNTFRRDDGPSGGYGRPAFGQASSERRDAPRAAAPTRDVPAPSRGPVPVARLKNGVRDANRALAEVVEQFGHTLEGGYDISELEVTVSFGDDGRFLGFGQGGAAAMTLSITPVDSEALLDADEDTGVDMDESLEGGAMADASFDDDDEQEDDIDESAMMRSTNSDTDAAEDEDDALHENLASKSAELASHAEKSARSKTPQPTFDA